MKPSIRMEFENWTPDTASIYNEGMTTIQNCMPYLQLPNYSQSPSVSLSAIGNINSSSTVVNAVKFDGSTNYLSIANLGMSDSKVGSISLWVRLDSNISQQIVAFGGGTGGGATSHFQVLYTAAGKFQILGVNSLGGIILNIITTNTYSSGATWYNILASWNLATATTNLYVNSVSDKTVNTATNDTINYSDHVLTSYVGNFNASDGAGHLFAGALAELWFDPTSTIDFTGAPNRAKFISGGFPVSLGSTGQTPTGSTPILYLKGAANANNINSGTGGNFTLNGTFAIASSSPSDSSPTQYLGAITVIDTNDLLHTYAGTTNKIAEITATTANNVSKAGGYTCTTYWKFAPFTASGVDNVYATDLADNVQVMAVGGTAFADLGGSPPKAQHIAQVGQFIVLGRTNGGTYGGGTAGEVPNRVWWSAIGNPADWTDPLTSAGAAKQTGAQDLNLIYGAVQHITNGQLYGLVFQENAITNMYYQGGDAVFNFNIYEKQRGLYCPNAAIQIGSLVYFPHSSGWFVTDGATVEPIGHNFVDNTWLADVNTAYLDHVRASHDVANKCIWWSYPSLTSTLQGGFVVCDKVIVYNYADKRWGMGMVGQSIDIIFNAFTLGYTMEQLDSVNSNLDLITPSLDSPYWNGGQPTVGMFGIQQIGTSGSYASYYGSFTGTPLTATLVTKTVNLNQGGRAFVTAAKPIVTGATPANISVYMGTQILPTDNVTYSSASTPETRTGKCSFRSDGVFHTAKVTISGGFTNALGVEPEPRASGWA